MSATQAVLQADELVFVRAIAERIHATFFADNEDGNLNKFSEERITSCANYIISQRVFSLPVLGTVTYKETHFTRLCDLDPHVQSVTVFLYPRKARYVLHVKTIRERASVLNCTSVVDLSGYAVPTVEGADAQWWNLTRKYTDNDRMCSLCVCVSVHLFLWVRPLLALTGDCSGVTKDPTVRIIKAGHDHVILRCTILVSASESTGYKIDQEIYEMLRSISAKHILSIEVIVEAQAQQHRIVINVTVREITTSARVDWKPIYNALRKAKAVMGAGMDAGAGAGAWTENNTAAAAAAAAASSVHKRARMKLDPTFRPHMNGGGGGGDGGKLSRFL
jgi:hypothetical protein